MPLVFARFQLFSLSTGKAASVQAMQSFYQVLTHFSYFFFIPVTGESACSWNEDSYYLCEATYYSTGLNQLVSWQTFHFSAWHWGWNTLDYPMEFNESGKIKLRLLQWVLTFKYVTIYLNSFLTIWFWLLLQVSYWPSVPSAWLRRPLVWLSYFHRKCKNKLFRKKNKIKTSQNWDKPFITFSLKIRCRWSWNKYKFRCKWTQAIFFLFFFFPQDILGSCWDYRKLSAN